MQKFTIFCRFSAFLCVFMQKEPPEGGLISRPTHGRRKLWLVSGCSYIFFRSPLGQFGPYNWALILYGLPLFYYITKNRPEGRRKLDYLALATRIPGGGYHRSAKYRLPRNAWAYHRKLHFYSITFSILKQDGALPSLDRGYVSSSISALHFWHPP